MAKKPSPLLTGGMVALAFGVVNLGRIKGPATLTLSILLIVVGLGLVIFDWVRSRG
jgi:hypothetical protein